MTEPLDLAAFVHDALAPSKMTTETIKELTRSIAEATEGDAAKAAMFDALVDRLQDCVDDLRPWDNEFGRYDPVGVQTIERARAVLASARRMGKEGDTNA